MHLQTWFVALFLGFFTLSSQVHGQNSDQPPSVNSQENIVETLSLPIRIVEDDETVQRQAEELRIQRSMEKSARWAMYAAIASVFAALASVVLVGIGTWLLRNTLILTRKATQAAQDAVGVTREVARDQARAYVHIDKVAFFWGNRFGSSPQFFMTAINSGQTPAKWFEVVSACKGSKIEQASPEFSTEELSSRNWHRWVSFPAGETQTITGNISENDFKSLKAAYGQPVRTITDPFTQEKVVITVYGTIRYCTIFDEVYEVDFFFQAINAHKYKEISRDVVGQKTNDGPVPINIIQTKEQPIKLSQLPSDALRGLEKVTVGNK